MGYVVEPTNDPTLDPRITNLENDVFKVTYYEIISGTSGTITPPANATINSAEFGLSGNAVLSKINGSNKATFETPKDSSGNAVTASLNVSNGNWVSSGTFTDSNVALIYSINISAKDYSNLDNFYIIETVDTNSSSGLSSPQGLIQIHDPSGTFFTDLATANAYVLSFDPTSALVITDESFSEGVYSFTVPPNTDLSGASGFISGGSYACSIIDRFGLITKFGDSALVGLNECIIGNSNITTILGDDCGQVTKGSFTFCQFGLRAFSANSGILEFNNCSFLDNAFFVPTYGNYKLTGCSFANDSFYAAQNNIIESIGCTFQNNAFILAEKNTITFDAASFLKGAFSQSNTNKISITSAATFDGSSTVDNDNAFSNDNNNDVTLGDLTLTTATSRFAVNSNSRFKFTGNIGTTEAQNYSNFFRTSTATITANISKLTSNAGGLEGDLNRARLNGAKLDFYGIDKEDTSNKSNSVLDFASTSKFPVFNVVSTGTFPMSNKRIIPRVVTIASTATITPNWDITDLYTVTALAIAANIAAPTGTPNGGEVLALRIKDNGTARALTFDLTYRFSIYLPAPTTTEISKTLYMFFMYNATDSKYDCVSWLSGF